MIEVNAVYRDFIVAIALFIALPDHYFRIQRVCLIYCTLITTKIETNAAGLLFFINYLSF
ncbi:MAG TPA: hypothetical protein VFC69_06390 [Dysgonamonadaceae bacterium]|nr:hypothetical protein [Dysgonamonadaceae bacterium]